MNFLKNQKLKSKKTLFGFSLSSGGRTLLARKGFSLIEMVVYVALLAIILVSLLTGVRLMLRSYGDGKNRTALASAGQLAMERMVREIRAASSINSGSSTFGTSTGALSLTQTSGSN